MINQFENEYVTNIYEEIAEHFSLTRYSHWKAVKDYLDNFNYQYINSEEDVKILDFGCGNGKYFSLIDKKINIYAIDNCEKLLSIVNKTFSNVKTIKADICDELNIFEFDSNSFDSIISIAVIHHLSTEYRRIQMIKNIFKLLKSGKTCLITMWTTNINKSKFTKLSTDGDYLIPWNNKYLRYYHLFELDEFENLIITGNLSDKIKILSKKIECDNLIYEIKKL